MRQYRARWIDAEGQEVRNDRFDWDPESHSMWGYMREEVRELALVLDAPYFNLRELQVFLRGHIEGAWRPWGYFIVNDEGMLRDGWRANPSPFVNPILEPSTPLYGPVVLVEIVE